MRYIRRILASLRRADQDFSLIDEGDKILVGLSGGKDSLTLLKALSLYGLFSKKKFTVRPVFLDLGFGLVDTAPLKAFCASLGYDLYVSDSKFVYGVLKAHTEPGKHIPCSICSRMKKAAMNSVAHELGYNKVAFAHHSDDAVETLFMNMIHGGRVATFEPKMNLDRSGIAFIRPLIYCHESDIRACAIEEKLPVTASQCPANGFTDRAKTKDALASIYRQWPEAKDNFSEMLSKYEPFCLFFAKIEHENPTDPTYALQPIVTPDEMRHSFRLKDKAKLENEKDFLILRRHRPVGEISYRHLTAHHVEIFNLYAAADLAMVLAIRQLVRDISEAVNPVVITLAHAKKSVAETSGFAKEKGSGEKPNPYMLRISK